MCKSSYYIFNTCGHLVIHCYDPCTKVLWDAGHNESLAWCTPEILNRSLEWDGNDEDEPPKPVEFLGVTGSCKSCARYFNLPDQIHEFMPSRNQALIYGPQNPFNSQDYAPRLQTDCVCATVPELMGIHDQLDRNLENLGPKVWFAGTTTTTSWARLRGRQLGSLGERICVIKGEWLGTLEPTSSNTILSLKGCKWGLTAAEKITISMAIQNSGDLQGLYKLLEKRGMPVEFYRTCLVKIRASLHNHGTEKLGQILMGTNTCEAASSSENNGGFPSTPSLNMTPRRRGASAATPEPPSSRTLPREDPFVTPEPSLSSATQPREAPVVAPEDMSEEQLTAYLLSIDNVQSYHHYLAWKAAQQQPLDDPFVDLPAGSRAQAPKRAVEKAPEPHMPNTATPDPSSASLVPGHSASDAHGNTGGGDSSAPPLQETAQSQDAQRLATLGQPSQQPHASPSLFFWEKPKERWTHPFPWDSLTPTFARCMAWLPEKKQIDGARKLEAHWRVIRRAKAGDVRVEELELKEAKSKVKGQGILLLFQAFENESLAWEEAHPGQVVDEEWSYIRRHGGPSAPSARARRRPRCRA